jgi:Mg-chelatase subunit ChlD
MNDPIGNSQTGSAAQRKIDAAKQQLKAALAGLENGDLFNIITYAVDVKPWQRRMVKRTAKVAKQVERFIDNEIEAEGGTNIHDALRDAFRLAGIGAMDKAYESNVDTIFFLTDGRPSVGEVQDPEEILLRVKDWNRLARIVVHTVGVGQDHDGSFLRRLAEENGGQYTSR